MAIYSNNIEGLDELIKAFKKLPEGSAKYVTEAAADIGGKIRDRAKQLAPAKSGNLRNKITVKKPTKSGISKFKIISTVGFSKGAVYGVPVELGHKMSGIYAGKRTKEGSDRVEGKPFLRPAANENEGYALERMTKALNDALEEFGR